MSIADLFQQLSDSSEPIKATGLTQLSALNGEETREFAEHWPLLDPDRKQQLLDLLIELAEDNVELNFDAVFLATLTDEDADVRQLAIRGLWEYEERDLAGRLVEVLDHDPDTEVRAEAALALGKYVLLAEMGKLPERHTHMVESALQHVLDDKQEPEVVRARALESAAVRSNASWVRQGITEAYESDDHRLRISAIHAMGRSCDGRWLPLLFRELNSDDAEARYEATLALGAIGDEEGVPRLEPLLLDEDPEVRGAAIASLGEIGGEQAREVLLGVINDPDQTDDAREAAHDALSEIDFSEDPLGFRIQPDE
ncbi:MAG TPA: HEAT repeat domain-containing protein [Dehalococcoidia bacterium]|nr:HEAT repeat domain-containing protein [Dehalococcoidia bacterium]